MSLKNDPGRLFPAVFNRRQAPVLLLCKAIPKFCNPNPSRLLLFFYLCNRQDDDPVNQ